jgi:hypothetical protein
MLFSRTIAIAAVLTAPVAAHAVCYDASDLGRGLVVSFSNDNTVIMRRNNAGLVEVTETYGDDDPNDTLYTGPHGLYFIEEVNTVNGVRDEPSRLEIDFTPAGGLPPAPTLGLSWRGPTLNIFADGASRDEIYSVDINSTRSYELSGCTYEAYVVRVRYEWPGEDGGFGLEYAYLPAIGSAFLVSSAVDDKSIPPNRPVSLTRAVK